MKYIVSSIRSIYLLNDQAIVRRIPRKSLTYGVTWSKEQVFMWSGGLQRVSKDWKTFTPVDCGKCSDVHQVLFDSRTNSILLADTGHNHLKRYGISDGTLEHIDWTAWNVSNGNFYRKKAGEERPKDVNHINSIWYDDNYYWVCEHNLSTISGLSSCVKKMTKHFEIVDEHKVGYCIHNVYIEDDMLYTCSSIQNRVVKYDIVKRKEVQVVGFDHIFKGFPRGLARSNAGFLVGLSNKAKRTDRQNKAPAHIVLLDNHLKIKSVVRLEDASQVFEIRLLDEPDRAHNNIRCPNDT